MGPANGGSDAGPDDERPGTEPPGDPDGTGTSPPAPGLPTNGTYPVRLELTDCDSLITAFFLPGRPEDLPRPPGWMPPETTPYTRVLLRGFECDRLSLGDFERPVRLLVESHNSGGGRPATCNTQSNVIIQNEVLTSIWVNDTEVAAFLDATYGFPVYHSPIVLEFEDLLPVGHEYTLRWGEGDSASWFAVTDDVGHNPESTRVNFRYYWYNGTVLGAMEFYHFSRGDQTGDNPAIGEMRPPMLMSDYSRDYASIGMWMPEARAEGHIELYGDLACEEPL